MYFQQFYLTCLAHASYMIGSEGTAAVVDPQRDVGIYLEDAEKQGLKISHIIETHLHADFVSGHIPGSIHIALNGQYASWAGTLLGLETPVVLVAEDAGRAEEARVRLARVGLEKAVGYLHDGLHAWQQAGLPLEEVPQISALQLYEQLRDHPGSVQVIDVRRPGEWAAGPPNC
jgi:rhodanese-related sulfurtransferase